MTNTAPSPYPSTPRREGIVEFASCFFLRALRGSFFVYLFLFIRRSMLDVGCSTFNQVLERRWRCYPKCDCLGGAVVPPVMFNLGVKIDRVTLFHQKGFITDGELECPLENRTEFFTVMGVGIAATPGLDGDKEGFHFSFRVFGEKKFKLGL